MPELYKPKWTFGRYHKTKSNSYALVYNLIESMAYFFEDESADLVQQILKVPKDGQISIHAIKDALDNKYSYEEIHDFLNELINVGLLTESLFTKEEIRNKRKANSQLTLYTEQPLKSEEPIQDGLIFRQNNSENAYMDILEKEGIPFVVMFELTFNCNEKCVHCFNPGAARNDNETSKRTDFEEIDIAHYKKTLNDLQALGVVKIIITGGDPFVKKDIWKLIKLIYERDFALDIYTNGIGLIGREETLADFYPKTVALSVYSGYDFVHDRITRLKGSLKKTLSAAMKLADIGVPLIFKCPIMYHNATSYYTVAELAKEHGASTLFDISLIDSIDGDTAITEQLQVTGELLEVILSDPRVSLHVGKDVPNFGKQDRDNSQPFCRAGTVFMNITPDGFVTPCNSFPTQFGNIRNQSFVEIWNESKSLNILKQTVIGDFKECNTQEICGYCSRCPGQSFVEHGNALKASKVNCRIATARMNLAKKLQSGIDPLENKTIEERLFDFKLDEKEIVSRKDNFNYRNKEFI